MSEQFGSLGCFFVCVVVVVVVVVLSPDSAAIHTSLEMAIRKGERYQQYSHMQFSEGGLYGAA